MGIMIKHGYRYPIAFYIVAYYYYYYHHHDADRL